jgi:hypothetical protein
MPLNCTGMQKNKHKQGSGTSSERRKFGLMDIQCSSALKSDLSGMESERDERPQKSSDGQHFLEQDKLAGIVV